MRPQAIMEIAPQPPPLLLPCGDEPLARPLEVRGQARGVDHHAGVVSQCLKQPPIGQGKARLSWARREVQKSHGLRVIHQRQWHSHARAVAKGRGQALVPPARACLLVLRLRRGRTGRS